MAKRITESKRITDFFASEVFNDNVAKEYMSKADYDALQEVIQNDGKLDMSLADKVANAMKEWAMSKGATHYTHWFQPLTGSTAEKHDSFISIDKNGNTILEFTGKNLSKGEADASSFPSGGIRATFEARGYTIWDVSSPAFIKKSQNGAGVLCIPTAFCSFTGETLDKKTPLLRSMVALDKEGRRLLNILGIKAHKVVANVGGEQEYFLVDKKIYERRDDLQLCGRTLFGAPAPKGQEKHDQYYGILKERVLDYMADLNEELWSLGITAKTQHNEAAPAQHELAPIFSTANQAVDQNQIIMEIMKKVANRHHMACLLHEKPFDGVNGSGKHDNWSLCTDDGRNLLEPGKTPQSNKVFLLFLLAIIGGVDKYQDLLKMSASNAGNDRRLGGNEAPPPIISIYVGDKLQAMFENLESGTQGIKQVKEYLKMGIPNLPKLKKDDSDRNRTSPFAFTGNKFEFRMVGSSQSLATPNIVLNTIAAEMIKQISDELEAELKTNKKDDLDSIISKLIVEWTKRHKRILFNGNNYSEDWRKEAVDRGLQVIPNAVESFKAMVKPENVELFDKHKVFSEKECKSRYEIYLSDYSKTLNIESLTCQSIVKTQILPAVMRYEGHLAKGAESLVKLGNFGKIQIETIAKFEELILDLNEKLTELEEATTVASQKADRMTKAVRYRDLVLPAMESLRVVVDKLQLLTEEKYWPYPNYADLLFYD